jgi:hypothetical protein
VHLDQHVEGKGLGASGKELHFFGRECGGDEQDCIGAMGARLKDLILIHHEVLAQAGQCHCRRSKFEIVQAALKMRLVREHGESCRATRLVALRKPSHVEIRANHALGRGRLFDFGNNRRSRSSATPQRCRPSSRLMQGRLPLNFRNGHARLCLSY